jgi:hypothetical protein
MDHGCCLQEAELDVSGSIALCFVCGDGNLYG